MRERRDAVMNGFRRLSIRFWAALTVSGALTSAVALPLTARALDARELAGGFQPRVTDERAAELDGRWGPGVGVPDGSFGTSDPSDPSDSSDGAHDADAVATSNDPTSRSGPATTASTTPPASTTTAPPATAGESPGAPATTTPPATAPPLPPAPTTTAAPPSQTTAPPPPTTASSSLLDGIIVISPGENEPALAVELSVGGGGEVSVPVTAEGCRNGGWRDYDVGFVSEAQCLTFVRRIDPTIAARVQAGLPLTGAQLASIELQLDALGLLTGLLDGVTGVLGGVTGLLGG